MAAADQMSSQVINEIAELIRGAKEEAPLLVGNDGIDAAGKTFFADRLGENLRTLGFPVLRASLDGFHNPRHIRYQRGKYSPEGYYYDSFNYELLIKYLLAPLAPGGNRKCRIHAFDHLKDREDDTDIWIATNAHILVFDGVFLFRPELRQYWDVKIFMDIDFQTCLNRVIKRDLHLFGNRQAVLKRYQERYIPGQKIYLESERPQLLADVVITNNDFTNPLISFRGSTSQLDNEGG